MSQVIAGIYEIQEKIGAGGGGVVYLGKHLRLNKQVVLKADKRTLSAGADTLRREVDMLKGLSQTYIPQVYDFVQEDGVVYTVMDYIEGESLDKLLARKEFPSQPQMIRWAVQLLEALDYLHSQPPYGILHGDIKPANIMLRPDGNICLIDFNIALALGEDGAVKVGFSRGYASPEHYGADYINQNRPAAVGTASSIKTGSQSQESKSTLLLENEDKTITLYEGKKRTEISENSAGSITRRKKGIMLDVRSDIYSLGATLYHVLSGKRPAEDAREVEPLGAEVCSPEISAILQKAMAPEPEMRYQSAKEMRTAFLQLHQNDRRVLRRRKRKVIAAAVLSVLFFIGGSSSFVGLKQLEQRQAALTLAEYSANALEKGEVSEAIRQALQGIPEEPGLLSGPVMPQVQKALTDALGVYELSDGFRALDTVALPSAPFEVVVSPQGTRFAVVYAYEAAVFEMDSLKEIVTLPIQNSALSDLLFLNESQIVYAGDNGVASYDLDTQSSVWVGETATNLALSGDHKTVAAVNRDERKAILYNASGGEKQGECSFGQLHLQVAVNDIFADPEDYIFALNKDGSLLAVSFYNGGLAVFDWKNPNNDLVIYEESDYDRFEGGFCGKYFAFTAEKSGESLFGMVDTVKGAYAGGIDSNDRFLLKTDEGGIYLANGNLLVNINPDTMEEKELAYTNSVSITAFSAEEKYTLAATEDNSFSFYDSGANLVSTERSTENCDFVSLTEKYAIIGNRNEPELRILELENHNEAQLLSYDARYLHEEARISQDRQRVMLFSYQNFCIYDMSGKLLMQMELPDSEFIYDQQFVRSNDGSWLEVIWYDGTTRRYSASDGQLIFEETGEKPSKELDEEFFVEGYRISSSLHNAPQVYELKSGRLVAVLEEDSYLTYVTQVGEYVITEYISAAGERYGILLDENFQKLAYLPGLCDVLEGMLVFDYKSGDLRQCPLYSLSELIELGNDSLKSNELKQG